MDLILFLSVLILLLISSFFSGSETSMMALNRYRLRHLAKKSPAARRAELLLQRPDRLLGVILIGNTFSNILASALATVLATHWFGDVGVAVATLILTLFVLLFAEILPKTLAATQPERLALPATWLLQGLQKLLYPLVWSLSAITKGMLRLFGVHLPDHNHIDALTPEELRSVVHASGSGLTGQHKNMLLGVLDLEHATVADAMLPRQSVQGIDLNDGWLKILDYLRTTPFSKLPVYRDNIDHVVGILHLRRLIGFTESTPQPIMALERLLFPPYFVPETTTLQQQLINFQNHSEHMALVVDEYGDIQGLVTVEDILEEIVGEFTNFSQPSAHIHTHKQTDGSVMVNGSMTLRDLNRDLHLHLPTNGPKTLSGLVVEYLEDIPQAATCVKINGYPIEILQVKDNAVKKAKIHPHINPAEEHHYETT
jgi:Mg2+/Co2+ transporter CorB